MFYSVCSVNAVILILLRDESMPRKRFVLSTDAGRLTLEVASTNVCEGAVTFFGLGWTRYDVENAREC